MNLQCIDELKSGVIPYLGLDSLQKPPPLLNKKTFKKEGLRKVILLGLRGRLAQALSPKKQIFLGILFCMRMQIIKVMMRAA